MLASRRRMTPLLMMQQREAMFAEFQNCRSHPGTNIDKVALVRELAHERKMRQQQTLLVATLMQRIRTLECEIDALQHRHPSVNDTDNGGDAPDSVGALEHF